MQQLVYDPNIYARYANVLAPLSTSSSVLDLASQILEVHQVATDVLQRINSDGYDFGPQTTALIEKEKYKGLYIDVYNACRQEAISTAHRYLKGAEEKAPGVIAQLKMHGDVECATALRKMEAQFTGKGLRNCTILTAFLALAVGVGMCAYQEQLGR